MPIQQAKFVKRFGANVRRERDKRAITQEKLAEKISLNIRNVQRIEKGEINVLITTAQRIKEALGCSWDSLFN